VACSGWIKSFDLKAFYAYKNGCKRAVVEYGQWSLHMQSKATSKNRLIGIWPQFKTVAYWR
jgi:hypothetical protein